MKATLDPVTKLLSLDIENSPRFKRFEAGIGWLNPKGQDTYALHWLLVVGEKEDGAYVVITEASAQDVNELAQHAIEWKDRLLIKRISVDESEEGHVLTLRDTRQTDGLCGYATNGMTLLRKPKYTHKPEHWPYFRTRDTSTAILPTRTTIEAGFDQITRLSQCGRIVYRDNVPWTRWLLRQRVLKDIWEHPLLLAFVHVLDSMERTKEQDVKHKQPKPWYGNPNLKA